MCCRCAISNFDHQIDVCKNRVTDSKIISGIKMRRTKCTNIVNNILSGHLETDLRADIGDDKLLL